MLNEVLVPSPDQHLDLVMTDVFDSLLFRTVTSKRSRLAQSEKCFAKFLREEGFSIPDEHLFQVRLLAEQMAYRALNMAAGQGEVRLHDLIVRQLSVLGLPQSLAPTRLRIEIETEKESLRANGQLAMFLRHQKQLGTKVVALTDTSLSSEMISELIGYFHGPALIDKVYSSADLQATKREGTLFAKVLQEEGVDASRVLHIGDDELADRLVPSSIGISTMHLPKSRLKKLASNADGATTTALRHARQHMRFRHVIPPIADPTLFGERIFGPIVAEFCLRLWLYSQEAAQMGQPVLLFCARGGLGIREAFERWQCALGLSLPIRRNNILISRLVAARSAIAERRTAVIDELAREFAGANFDSVAHALGGRSYDLPEHWQMAFDASKLFEMLDSDAGNFVNNDIRWQNDLFILHLDQLASDASPIILCDTGLYGSTQKLLSAALPERDIKTVQFARCNYKGLGEDHFSQVAGLITEERYYNPLETRTVVLRYWHIIESLFEPGIPSVKALDVEADGRVVANSGPIDFGSFDPAEANPLLRGALRYIDNLTDNVQVLEEVDQAWARLKQAITNPSLDDMNVLDVGARSVDFGRSEHVPIVASGAARGRRYKVSSLKSHLWREGAIAQEFPLLKPALLRAIEVGHVVRRLSARARR